MLSALTALRETFSPLRNGSLRLYLFGQALSLLGTFMQATAQAWVVWQLSHSPFTLSLVALLSTLPFLLIGPWAGVWADRLDRRWFLISLQSAAMLLAFILALFVQLGIIQIWHACLIALLLGVVATFDMTVQQAFVSDLTPHEQIRQAIVINGALIQVGRTAGPLLASWVIIAWGVATAFWFNGFSFLAVIVTLLLLHPQPLTKPSSGRFWSSFRESCAR